LWGLENACSNNYHSIYFSPLDYRGKWLLLVRDIKKQPKVLDILQELVVEKKARDMMEDLSGVGVPLEEYSEDESAGD
jgi:hypothetical protein